jgi:hypothetical protein
MTDVEKVLRYAKTLHNACKNAYKNGKCKECKFSSYSGMGCSLNGHPIEWDDKFKK